jgi:hypothetical protein
VDVQRGRLGNRFKTGVMFKDCAFLDCKLVVLADPLGGAGQVFAGFSGSIVRGQGEYLVFGKVQGYGLNFFNKVEIY